MENTLLASLMRAYQRLVLAIGFFLPAFGIGFLMATTDLKRPFALHTFHTIAITIAVFLSGFVAFVAYKSYQKAPNPFVRFVGLAYLGFTIIYTPHGALTYMADHNMIQFLIFGPVSRLVMSIYLFAGLFQLDATPKIRAANELSVESKRGWLPHAILFAIIAIILYVVTENFRLKPIQLKAIESTALLISCLSIWRMWRLPFRSSLMRFHLLAQILFAQASLSFILSLPWNSLWWFAHVLSATGFITLGYGVTRIYLGTRSLSSIYNDIMLHSILDKIVEHSPVGILVADQKLHIIYCNRMMENMLSCSDGDNNAADKLFMHLKLTSNNIHEAIDLTNSPMLTRRFELLNQESNYIYEARVAQLDGVNTPSGFICILIDISESSKAEEAIRNLNENLKHEVAERTAINQELESFCYSVSHDLRSPLRAMEGFSHLLEEGHGAQLGDEGLRHLRSVRDNSKKMGQLIDDLLTFSRLGRTPLQENSTVDMKSIVNEVLTDIGITSRKHQVDIKVGELPPATGDITPLRQVWVNLISNAIKFSAKSTQPVVEVYGYRQNAETIYCVKDNGVGFDMKYYDKLFRIFQRLHGQNEFDGTGVGLAIVQRLVTRHGGRVWAESEIGKGATFFFSLPDLKA